MVKPKCLCGSAPCATRVPICAVRTELRGARRRSRDYRGCRHPATRAFWGEPASALPASCTPFDRRPRGHVGKRFVVCLGGGSGDHRGRIAPGHDSVRAGADVSDDGGKARRDLNARARCGCGLPPVAALRRTRWAHHLTAHARLAPGTRHRRRSRTLLADQDAEPTCDRASRITSLTACGWEIMIT